jgi:carbamoyl-phosphate synthase small subunit
VVFTTGMTGYPETLTDPSFAGQIIVFTYPLIGNYGVPDPSKWESKKIWAKGVILGSLTDGCNHHEEVDSLLNWLSSQNVGWLSGVDTRALTRHLRSRGTVGGTLGPKLLPTPSLKTIVSEVSTKTPYTVTSGPRKKKIIAVDCGIKENLLRSLEHEGIEVVKVPYNYDYTQETFDGLFLSNGPGDPEDCTETIAILKKALMLKKPIFGVCLGTQLMALATGAKTYKLPFGHRGQNQPVKELLSQKCYITSQNHGYAIDKESLPENWEIRFENLNDGSVEGIAHKTLPYSSVQFHPEANPGPHDTLWLFQEFIEKVLNTP